MYKRQDVYGFSPVNVGRMQIGEPCYLPCTPAGCIRMIESTGTDLSLIHIWPAILRQMPL